MLRNGLGYSVAEWCKDNAYLSRNSHQNDERSLEYLHSAVREYCLHVMPPMSLNGCATKINDSLLVIAQYLSSVSRFIRNISHDSKYPFQCDVCFGVEAVPHPAFHDDGDDDRDSSDDDDNDDDKEPGVEYSSDYVGDLHNKLRHAQLKFVHKTVSPNVYAAEKYIANAAFAQSEECQRLADQMCIFDDDFVAFYNEVHPRNPVVADSQPRPRSKGSSDSITLLFEEAFAEFKQKLPEGDRTEYPKQRRFCVFVDRHAPHRGAQSVDGDEITIFEPPSDCDSLPEDCVEERFLETVRSCIIPHRGYGAEQRDETLQRPSSQIPKNDQTITGLSRAGGTILTFSFQVMSRDQIACRVYWNGSTQRFLPTDIGEILPALFGERIRTTSVKPQPKRDAPAQRMKKKDKKNDKGKMKQSHAQRGISAQIKVVRKIIFRNVHVFMYRMCG